MNMIGSFLIEMALTLSICILAVAYLRRYLHRILLDLCGNEERAEFWTVFSIFILVGIPAILALNFRPETIASQEMFFEIIGRLGTNLASYLVALVGIGVIVSFFALVAPRPDKVETK
jgi:uncharacterized membrane protein YhaH (DUF805 family)